MWRKELEDAGCSRALVHRQRIEVRFRFGHAESDFFGPGSERAEPIADQLHHGSLPEGQGRRWWTRGRRRGWGVGDGTDFRSALRGLLSEAGVLPFELVDEVCNGCLQLLALVPELLFESFEAKPLQLELRLPALEGEEHIVIPSRDRLEELEGVPEVTDRARPEHGVDPNRELTHVGLGGASVQLLLQRVGLS